MLRQAEDVVATILGVPGARFHKITGGGGWS
jgi:hypothetical protein